MQKGSDSSLERLLCVQPLRKHPIHNCDHRPPTFPVFFFGFMHRNNKALLVVPTEDLWDFYLRRSKPAAVLLTCAGPFSLGGAEGLESSNSTGRVLRARLFL